jgi:hypothetical protein
VAAHGGAQICQSSLRQRAEYEIKQQAQQELDIHPDPKEAAGPAVSRRPFPLPQPAPIGAEQGQDSQDQDHPAKKIVQAKENIVHGIPSCEFIDLLTGR